MSEACGLSWSQRRTLARGALRDFALRCDAATLDAALQLAQSSDAAFVTCLLGRNNNNNNNRHCCCHDSECACVARDGDDTRRSASCDVCSNALSPLLYGAQCPCSLSATMQQQRLQQSQSQSSYTMTCGGVCSEDVAQVVGASSWAALQQTSAVLPQRLCGVVTPSWSSPRQRARMATQLQLAGYLGLRAVLVPLPRCRDEAEATTTTVWRANTTSDEAAAAWRRRTHDDDDDDDDCCCDVASVCRAAEVLRAFVRTHAQVKVWVRCCASAPRQRRVLHALRRAVVYGYYRTRTHATTTTAACSDTANMTTTALTASDGCARCGFRIHDATTQSADVRHEAVASLLPWLYFALPTTTTTAATTTCSDVYVSTSWLGEDVVAFESPPQLSSRDTPPPQRPCHARNAVSCNDRNDDEDGERDSACDGDDETCDVPGLSSSVAARWGGAACAASPSSASPSSCLTRLPLRAFIVELMRRRAVPVLVLDYDNNNDNNNNNNNDNVCTRAATAAAAQRVVHEYALLARLYARHVRDTARDAFAHTEDALLLPLQPLTQPLPSGVYEVFERDVAKYRAYTTALQRYMADWLRAPRHTHHHAYVHRDYIRRRQRGQRCAATDNDNDNNNNDESNDDDALYVTILGVGRGPLVDACFRAAALVTAAAVAADDDDDDERTVAASRPLRLRVTAYECNAMAAAYTRARWRHDAVWRQYVTTHRHTLDVVACDARDIDALDAASQQQHCCGASNNNNNDNATRVSLPCDVGVCDVVVSELLGSVGDNELSPECVDGFVAALRRLQTRRALTHNAQLVSIPQRYTAWAAPLHSTRAETAVAAAARRGLTVPATTRPTTATITTATDGALVRNAYTAFHHSMYVSNLCRAVLLAPAQPCWSFVHPTTHNDDDDNNNTRSATRTFVVPRDGRCSGIACFFSVDLYRDNNNDDNNDNNNDNDDNTDDAVMADGRVVRLSTEASQRSADLYSWFPCYCALPPSRVRDLVDVVSPHTTTPRENDTDATTTTTTLTLHLRRCVAAQTRHVWYAWSVRYADEADATVTMNDDGWAAAMRY